MYHLFGLHHSLVNVGLLARPKLGRRGRVSLAKLRRAYHAVLSERDPSLDALPVRGPLVVRDPLTIQKLCSGFDLAGPEVAAPRPWQRRMLAEGLAWMKERDPVLSGLVSLVVSAYLVGSNSVNPKSMTSFKLLGVLYINPQKEWSAADVAEVMLHELTHMLVVLDDFRHGHFVDGRVFSVEEFAGLGAISGKSLPIFRVTHSQLVAAELMLFRERHGLHGVNYHAHPDSETLATRIDASFATYRADTSLGAVLTPRMRELLSAAEAQLPRRKTLEASWSA